MNQMTLKADAKLETLRQYDPCYSTLHQMRVRFLRREGGFVVVADNAGKELPDLVHESQIRCY